MHGPTYMANPLACSAANATLDYIERFNILRKVKVIENYFSVNLPKFNEYSFVKATRYLGAIGVIEVFDIDKKKLEWLRNEYINRGIWARPLRNVIYFMPPFVIKNQLDMIFKATTEIFNLWKK